MGARRFSVTFGLAATFLFIPIAAFADAVIEAQVREYFSDVPVMANIAACESKFTQFGKDGTALRGGMSGKMIGLFQIYEDIHADYAKGLGMDIYTTEGNLAYTRHLYEREGTRPWNSSASCWEGMAVASSSPRVVIAQVNPLGDAPRIVNEIIPPFTRNLSIGIEHEEVRTLQKFLNGAGYTIVASGAGSPGKETMRFGALTRAALRKFQCEKSIVCDGDEGSTGFGFFGPRTREALLATPQDLARAPLDFSATSSPPYTKEQEPEVRRLQAQIAELTKLLAELLAKQGT